MPLLLVRTVYNWRQVERALAVLREHKQLIVRPEQVFICWVQASDALGGWAGLVAQDYCTIDAAAHTSVRFTDHVGIRDVMQLLFGGVVREECVHYPHQTCNKSRLGAAAYWSGISSCPYRHAHNYVHVEEGC
jgi:hypothetical protein